MWNPFPLLMLTIPLVKDWANLAPQLNTMALFHGLSSRTPRPSFSVTRERSVFFWRDIAEPHRDTIRFVWNLSTLEGLEFTLFRREIGKAKRDWLMKRPQNLVESSWHSRFWANELQQLTSERMKIAGFKLMATYRKWARPRKLIAFLNKRQGPEHISFCRGAESLLKVYWSLKISLYTNELLYKYSKTEKNIFPDPNLIS